MNACRLLLFDLDGTLLRSDKTIYIRTLEVLQKYRNAGILIGVSTSRSELNALSFVEEIKTILAPLSFASLVTSNKCGVLLL